MIVIRSGVPFNPHEGDRTASDRYRNFSKGDFDEKGSLMDFNRIGYDIGCCFGSR
jgi:hypothetical protein